MNIRFLIFLFVAFVVGLSSCKNNDEVFKTTVYSYYNVINASSDSLNIYINGTRQNNSSSIIPGGATLYFTVPDGPQTYQFKKIGGFNVLFSLPLTLQDSVYHTTYVTSETADGAFTTIDSLYLDTVKTQIRFVNASPDAGPLNVTIGDTVSFSSRAYKTSSVFVHVGEGQKRIQVYTAGASVASLDTTVAMFINSGYTVYARGRLHGAGNSAFKIGLVKNFSGSGN